MIDSNILKIDKLSSSNVSRETLKELEDYSNAIILRNKRVNLISKSTENSIKQRHIEDSAQIIDKGLNALEIITSVVKFFSSNMFF